MRDKNVRRNKILPSFEVNKENQVTLPASPISSFWGFLEVFVAAFCRKLSTTSRFILKQLDYSLSISI